MRLAERAIRAVPKADVASLGVGLGLEAGIGQHTEQGGPGATLAGTGPGLVARLGAEPSPLFPRGLGDRVPGRAATQRIERRSEVARGTFIAT